MKRLAKMHLLLPAGASTLMLWLGLINMVTPGYAATGVANISSACDIEAFSRIESNFQRMVQLRAENPTLFSEEEYKVAALNYIASAEQCYQATVPAKIQSNSDPIYIDDGGVWVPGFEPPPDDDLSGKYVTHGSKWGSSSFGTSGGTVTYSYMADGVSHAAEGVGAGANTDIRTGLSGIGSNPCVQTQIANAFAAWSAVSNIEFVEVADNGAPSDGAGAIGDIRLGAHFFDGSGGVLAHAYFPPPNGTSIAGDLHFDTADTWSCTSSGGFDIGIVALHEIGHSIGLEHQSSPPTAVMNPTYNPSLTQLLPDDINGATAVYGPAPRLTLTKTASPNPVTIGQPLTYTLLVSNDSQITMTNITVTDQVPANTTLDPGSLSGASFSGTGAGSVITWTTPPSLLVGQSLSHTFVVTVNLGVANNTVINNIASASADRYQMTPYAPASYQSESSSTAINVAAPDLNISMSSDPSPIEATTTLITYTIRVDNTGNAAATGVTITNTIPSSTTYVGSSASHGGTFNDPNLIWSGITISAGSNITRSFRVSVTETLTDGDQLINVVSLTSAQEINIENSNQISVVGLKIYYLPLIVKNN